jgi:hypothetical protein
MAKSVRAIILRMAQDRLHDFNFGFLRTLVYFDFKMDFGADFSLK